MKKGLAKKILGQVSVYSILILFGICFQAHEVVAADFCCAYFKGAGPETSMCMVRNVSQPDKFSDPIPDVLQKSSGFSCSDHAEGSVFYSTPEQGDDSYTLLSNDVVAPNNFAAAIKGSNVNVNTGSSATDACMAVSGYSAKLYVAGVNDLSTQAGKLCKLGEQLFNEDFEFQGAALDAVNDVKGQFEEAFTELTDLVKSTAPTMCCIPKLPDGARKCETPGPNPELSKILGTDMLNTDAVNKNGLIAQTLLEEIKKGNIALHTLLACDTTNFAFYPVACNSTTQVTPPSTEYKKQGFSPTPDSYCREAEGDQKAPEQKISPRPPSTFDATVLNRLGTTDLKVYAGRIIKGVMGILGSLTLVMFVYSGILFMTDRGNGESVGKAKDIAVWTSLGLVVIFASYAILSFVFQIFGK